jgi:Tfp pilus assembly protein PilF/peroxiredoxin
MAVSLPLRPSDAAGRVERPRSAGQPYRYSPKLEVSDTLRPFLAEIGPGSDLIPDERVAAQLKARLAELGDRLRQSPTRAASVADLLLAPAFRGGRLQPVEEVAVARQPALQIFRGRTMPRDLVLDGRSFGGELRRLVDGFRQVTVAEFLITSLDVTRGGELASTDVRYDILGPGKDAWRVERLGVWRLRWQRTASGWRVLEWTATAHLRSSASAPIFTEVTTAALGGNDSFRRQLSIGFDAWVATIDSVLTRDSNAHNGVSVGDADGDGLDDIYAAQPQGFPNRLYRARGDGSFEDVTEKAGVGVLEDTSHSLFADVDNDGDEDLLLTISAGPVLFLNDGAGRFTRVPGAFRYQKALQGAPMSLAMADYDRDGFLDVYLSVYSFYYGAGEGKGGTPVPYHDAQNGPPNVLFRNDGHGRFVDVTRDVGLDAANDRFSFSAAWGDYDGDGWPDLVVTNDFGRKNLYHNLGLRDGEVRFEDVAAQAGVEDHAAGMSISWLDFDGDGRLDIYAGQMWSDNGLRVTANPAFMPEADAKVHELYRHHARGNSLFRNRGDGTFEDVTLAARAEMGRWSWSTGPVDFDSDGWEDLYCVNGMVTRGPEDLDWFFWGGIIARSPLTAATGTPYDDAWRAINRFMVHRSIAGHHRNVFLRNDGQGGFDDVSGSLGLDLDQDGRAFAVLDYDRDGDPDLVLMAARSAPQLRLFRNDYPERGATLAVRLIGTPSSPSGAQRWVSNRDAIGARVTVETDLLRRTKTVNAGSGFLSQHSKELLFGLGASQRLVRLTVEWPSGRTQVFTDVPLNHRIRIEEGAEPRKEPYGTSPPLPADAPVAKPASPPCTTWLYDPAPAPDFSLQDLRGEARSLSALRGRPAVVLFWATEAATSRAALHALAEGSEALAQAGIGALAVALDAPSDLPKVRAAASGVTTLPVLPASEDVALSYAILNRHLFMNEPDLELPTAFLLDAEGRVVKAYRERVDVSEILQDAPRIEVPPAERLARALPFEGTLYSPPGERNDMAYGRELQDQGLDGPALAAFERAAQGKPSSSTLYRLGTLLVKSGQTAKARTAFERALAMQPNLSEASNDLGTLLAQNGDIPAAIERFRAALDATPDYPDALNNLGYAFLLTGREPEARELYEKALKLQPDFPEALNNLGLVLGRAGELDHAEPYFRKALQKRPDYGEAANNLALVLVGRGQSDEAIRLLQAFIEKTPESESAYLTLAKIYLAMDRRREGLAVVERLLERNPTHGPALELARQFR